jgi:hypothetical protein
MKSKQVNKAKLTKVEKMSLIQLIRLKPETVFPPKNG